jgi:hypothetical protein
VLQLKKLDQQHPETPAAAAARRALQVINSRDEYQLINREPTYVEPGGSNGPPIPMEVVPRRESF